MNVSVSKDAAPLVSPMWVHLLNTGAPTPSHNKVTDPIQAGSKLEETPATASTTQARATGTSGLIGARELAQLESHYRLAAAGCPGENAAGLSAAEHGGARRHR